MTTKSSTFESRTTVRAASTLTLRAAHAGDAAWPSSRAPRDPPGYCGSCRTDRMFPAGSLNHAMDGPPSAREIPFSS